MNEWKTAQELTANERAYQRRRIIRALRGWLHTYSRPRLLTALMLVVALAAGNLLGAVLPLTGFWRAPVWAGVAIMVAWPIFAGLMLWLARWEFRQFAMAGSPAELLLRDGAEESGVYDDSDLGNFRGWLNWDADAGWFLVLYLLAVFLGRLFWDLIRQGPTLLTELYLDRTLCARLPELHRSIDGQNWVSDLFIGTALHFCGSAFCFATLAALVAYGLHF